VSKSWQLATATVAICIAVCRPGIANAQAANPGMQVLPVRDGDCHIKVRVPADADVRDLAILIDDTLITVRRVARQGDTARVRLAEPVRENQHVRAELPPFQAPAVRVQQATQQEGPPVASCDPPTYADDRAVFEASGYVGEAFDNFAPGEKQYINAATSTGAASRWLAGVEAQYRLVGDKGRPFQLWLASYTLHGVRSADIDCRATPSVALCQQHPPVGDKFLAILEHATTLEAHFDARVEFWTFQKSSEMPIKAYSIARFGFVDLTGSSKVHNSDAIGVGILSPFGVFKNSSAQVAWGRSEQFQSDTRWNRLKINGTLIFDVAPGLKDSLEFWKRLAGSPRAFVSIGVDRNPGGGSPDAVISYVGIDFDLRHIFFGFGG
jgi:hypothetical protein